MAKQTIVKEMTLYNDYDYNVEDYRDKYLDYCNCNDIEVDDEIPDWYISRKLDDDWCRLVDKLINEYNTECVLVGSLGLWWGSPTIVPQRFDSVFNAISKCIEKMDYVKVSIVNGHFEIKAMHHDGTNEFEIHILNKLGQKTMGADLTKECYHCKIKGDFWG